MKRRLLILLVCLVPLVWLSRAVAQPAPAVPNHLGYGFNMADLDYTLLQNIGFDWAKLFGGPGGQQPVNILVRIDANVTDLNNLAGFINEVSQLAAGSGDFIEAYEIGNEPNLDASYGWAAPPVAADYKTVLCAAYDAIKAQDPTAIVVSAGLAPTGRVSGNWNGHAGHNGLFQDEREFFREFLQAGGGACLDAVGYHPYGFSADYDVAPDSASSNPARNCTNGFCFRGTEKIYEIMVQNGLGEKKVWATEFGWITEPPAHCLSDPGWQGRAWQIVSEQKQASNLRGAFEYAHANWPWMGAMFVFNLNFNTVGWYAECEQMRFYGVEDRPAEDALRALVKYPATYGPGLSFGPGAFALMVTPADLPLTQVYELHLYNDGWQPASYVVTVDGSGDIVPTIQGDSGTLAPTESGVVGVTVATGNRPFGTYHGTVTISAPGVPGTPFDLPVTVQVVDDIQRLYLPSLPRP
ncbi:MAG: hypothetical protein KDE59_07210 [Anaerolineales bacterium]|nr:hypothetical protein [Anaerolineales bacterium]